MNPNGEGQHYLSLKQLPALLKGTTSKHQGDFCCLKCLKSHKSQKSHKILCRDKDFCNIVMPSEDTKI